MEAFLTVCPASEEGKLNWTDFESILRRQTGEQLQSDEISVIQKAMASLKVDKKGKIHKLILSLIAKR